MDLEDFLAVARATRVPAQLVLLGVAAGPEVFLAVVRRWSALEEVHRNTGAFHLLKNISPAEMARDGNNFMLSQMDRQNRHAFSECARIARLQDDTNVESKTRKRKRKTEEEEDEEDEEEEEEKKKGKGGGEGKEKKRKGKEKKRKGKEKEREREEEKKRKGKEKEREREEEEKRKGKEKEREREEEEKRKGKEKERERKKEKEEKKRRRDLQKEMELQRSSVVKFSPNIGLEAATAGHVDTVQWVIENTVHFPFRECMFSAASNGHFSVVRLLYQPDILFRYNETEKTAADFRVIDAALSKAHFEMVRFLCQKTGSSCTTRGVDAAARNATSSVEIFVWIYRTFKLLPSWESIRENTCLSLQIALIEWCALFRGDEPVQFRKVAEKARSASNQSISP